MNIFRLFSRKKKLSKDPNDYSKCSSSTEWELDEYYCGDCKKSTSVREYLSQVCSKCGSFKPQKRHDRSWRKIYINGKWKTQILYRAGGHEIINED